MARPISKTTKFILTLPPTLSAKEVLSKAKASGLETSESNVHRVRRLHGSRSAKKTKPVAAVASARTSGSRAGAEDVLRAAAAELGLGHAISILESQRAQVRAVFGR